MLPPILDPRASGWLTLVLAGLALATGLALALGPLDAPAPMTLGATNPRRGWPPVGASERGADEARRDLALGRPRILTWGHPSARRGEYAELLQERLGVELDPIAGCDVSDADIARARGYNAVVTSRLEASHGHDVLDKLWDAAEARHQARRAAREREREAHQAQVQAMLLEALADSSALEESARD